MIPRNVVLGGVFHDLVRYQIELWNAVDARLKADHDLPLGQFEHMTVISETPGCRILDIAETLVITVGGASKSIDRLEAAGRCARRANPDDKRSSFLELTPDGAELLAAATVTFEAELHARLAVVMDIEGFGANLRALRVERAVAKATTEDATGAGATAAQATAAQAVIS